MELPASSWLLGRRDVAILPWLCAALVSFGLIISVLLLGASTPGARLTLVCAALLAATGIGSALTHLTPLGPYLARQLWPYVVGSITIGVAIAGSLLADRQIGAVLISANVVVTFYVGLVLPPRYARDALLVVLGATLAIDVVVGSGLAEAALHFGIPLVGWMIGFLTARAHHRLAERARLLSSYDQLTRTLNRRGFADRLAWLLSDGEVRRHHLSLMVLDLDDFKVVNDTHGHAAGDELLGWVGEQLAELVPEDAECGRMGGDEFTIALPGADRRQAIAFADQLRERLSARINCSVGIATGDDPRVTADDLFRVADAALYACKRDRTLGVQAMVAGIARPNARPPGRPHGVPPIRYARVRQRRRAPDTQPRDLVTGWLAGRGLLVIAIAGALVVAEEMLYPGDSPAELVVRYAGIPWVLSVLALAAWVWHQQGLSHRRFNLVYVGSAAAIAIGVSSAMLAHGGIGAAIGAALYLKLQFDAAVFPMRRALVTAATILPTWAIVAILGPADMLWAAPFQLTLFAAAITLGSLGQRAFSDVSQQLLSLARTDSLTGALSRHGFDEHARQLFAQSEAAPVALLAIDLDAFKTINDTRGHAAGDEVLRQVVHITRLQLGPEAAVGRIGGDEFAVLLPRTSEFEARRAALEVMMALSPVVGASVGHAVAPPEGSTLAELQQIADARSYEAKLTARQRRVA